MVLNRSSVRLRLQLAAVPVSDRVCRTGFVRPKSPVAPSQRRLAPASRHQQGLRLREKKLNRFSLV